MAPTYPSRDDGAFATTFPHASAGDVRIQYLCGEPALAVPRLVRVCVAMKALDLEVKAQAGKKLTAADAGALRADIAGIESVEGC